MDAFHSWFGVGDILNSLPFQVWNGIESMWIEIIIIIIIIIHAFIFARKIKEGQIIKVEIFESEALWKDKMWI